MNAKAPHAQRGAVLAATLLLLMVLTLLALGASQATRTHERMAAAVQDRDLAFQSAEAMLRAAERLLDDPSLTLAPVPCALPRCRVYERAILSDRTANLPVDWWSDHAWTYTETNTWVPAASNSDGDEVGHGGQFFVEELEEVADSLTLSPSGPPPGRTYYRVTATARKDAQTAPVVLQSTFTRRFN